MQKIKTIEKEFEDVFQGRGNLLRLVTITEITGQSSENSHGMGTAGQLMQSGINSFMLEK